MWKKSWWALSLCATTLVCKYSYVCKYPHVHITKWGKLRALLSSVQVPNVLFSLHLIAHFAGWSVNIQGRSKLDDSFQGNRDSVFELTRWRRSRVKNRPSLPSQGCFSRGRFG